GTKVETVRVPGRNVDSFCNSNCVGAGPAIPVPSGTGGVSYVDMWHGQCQNSLHKCKLDTVCPIGTSKVSVNGVWKCQYPDSFHPKPTVTHPRGECLRNLKISISRIQTTGGPTPDAIVADGLERRVLVFGENTAFASSADATGGVQATIGAAAERL